MTVFLDTNLLVYRLDDRDIGKRDRARPWIAACAVHIVDPFVSSPEVLEATR